MPAPSHESAFVRRQVKSRVTAPAASKVPPLANRTIRSRIQLFYIKWEVQLNKNKNLPLRARLLNNRQGGAIGVPDKLHNFVVTGIARGEAIGTNIGRRVVVPAVGVYIGRFVGVIEREDGGVGIVGRWVRSPDEKAGDGETGGQNAAGVLGHEFHHRLGDLVVDFGHGSGPREGTTDCGGGREGEETGAGEHDQ